MKNSPGAAPAESDAVLAYGASEPTASRHTNSWIMQP